MINLKFLPIQLLISLFLFFALSRVFLRLKDRSIGLGQFFFWCGLWFLVFFTVFYPDFTTYWAKLLGIGRGVDAILYSSVIVLFYLVFRLHVLLENVHHEVTRLIREVALLPQKQLNNQHKKKKAKRKNW